jgi:hypothetical protein
MGIQINAQLQDSEYIRNVHRYQTVIECSIDCYNNLFIHQDFRNCY